MNSFFFSWLKQKSSGVGKAQYIYWVFLSIICLFDTAQMVVISTIIPLLRCEWGLSVLWETLTNTNVYLFSALGEKTSD